MPNNLFGSSLDHWISQSRTATREKKNNTKHGEEESAEQESVLPINIVQIEQR
jgi:hypothetical protein